MDGASTFQGLNLLQTQPLKSTFSNYSYSKEAMNYQPLVSVGIPTYNRPEGLRKTLVCITQQTYSKLEIIISDNASTDPQVKATAHEFMAKDDRIRYIRQPKNVGQFFNFKAVMAAATGDYFTWAADDDERAERYIEQCIQAFDLSSQLVVVNAYSRLIHPETEETLRIDRGCTTIGLSKSQRYRRYLSTIFTEQAVVGDLIYGLIRRETLTQTLTDIRILPWDHVLLARLALVGEFYTIPEPLLVSRLGGASRSNPSAARALLLEGTLAQQHPWWTREKWLQQSIWQSDLFVLSKLTLMGWSFLYYCVSFGAAATIKTYLPWLHRLYRSVRYQEPFQLRQKSTASG